MNERIRELKEQATRPAMWPGDPDAGELNAGKFAELIVRECCDIFVELRTRPADLAAKDVKKHFGVDE
jgi:hypothetical protein